MWVHGKDTISERCHDASCEASEVGDWISGEKAAVVILVQLLLVRKGNYLDARASKRQADALWEDKPVSRLFPFGSNVARLERSLAGTPITSRQLVESERQPDQHAVASSVSG